MLLMIVSESMLDLFSLYKEFRLFVYFQKIMMNLIGFIIEMFLKKIWLLMKPIMWYQQRDRLIIIVIFFQKFTQNTFFYSSISSSPWSFRSWWNLSSISTNGRTTTIWFSCLFWSISFSRIQVILWFSWRNQSLLSYYSSQNGSRLLFSPINRSIIFAINIDDIVIIVPKSWFSSSIESIIQLSLPRNVWFL